MSSRRLTALVAAMALSATGLAACGDDEEDTAAPPPPPAATQTDTAADEQPAAATVEVAADPGGDLDYVQDSLTARAGSVTFAFTNESSIPHDFNIEQDGEQVDGTEVITQSEEDLTVDLEPGQYTYYCSVANHREEGMEGELTIE
ncbi:MAG TPA: cupredoxin domain-containing protein [Solirubrobacteraceae bacterium]|nr:cupredoxin domain-containing protein [Solirubrobacteraceae bacterium]